jgi:drug/metabolite transporter (DMT)-like permease
MKKRELSWVEMALVVGVLMALCKPGHRLVGALAPTILHALLATGIVGLFGVLVGFWFAPRGSLSLVSLEGWYRWGPLYLGVGFVLATVCAFQAFSSAGAHVGINTFISGPLTILPSILLGTTFFHEKLTLKKLMAGIMSLGAAWLVTNATLSNGLPGWIVWSFGTCLFASSTRFLAKQIAKWGESNGHPKLNGWVLVFWAGVSMMILALLPVFAINPAVFASVTATRIVVYALIVAVPTILWWIGRFVAYQRNAPLGSKEVVLNAAYQGIASLIGYFFFRESLSIANLVGIGLCFAAIPLALEPAVKVLTLAVSEPVGPAVMPAVT